MSVRRLNEGRGWRLQIPQSIAGKLRRAIADEQPETILNTIYECYEFLVENLPEYFNEGDLEELRDDIDNELDNLENYEDYDMTYDDVVDNVDGWLNKLYDDCDDLRVFIPIAGMD